MNTDEVRDLPQTLSPPLDDPSNRFDEVRRRAHQRARTINLAVGGVVAATVLAGTAAVLTSVSPTTRSGSEDIATEHPAPTETVRYEEVGPLLGGTESIDLGEPISVTTAGARQVDLGPPPDGATAVDVSVVCLTVGRIVYPDGASIVCDRPASESEIADPRSANSTSMGLEPGQTSLRFRAPDSVRWKVVATYVRAETSEWGVNAKSETFGVHRDDEAPDLVAAYATNGKRGYVYGKDLDGPIPTSPADALAQQEANEGKTRSVPVYESDGETVVGEFVIGP